MVGPPKLIARVRRLKEGDVQAGLESPPPPTFTVPAFRARKHRGGESTLLKDAYPSGFCNPPDSRPPPTKTATTCSGSKTRIKEFSLDRHWLPDLLHEFKEVGVSPWGASSGWRVLNCTRVVFGATEVADTVGSALVQYGPGFSIGPAVHVSPERRGSNRFPLRRPPTPVSPTSPSRMTIDGSILRDQNSLLVEPSAVEHGNQWSPRKTCAADWTSPRDGDVFGGHKQIRPATNRAQSPGEPEPWPCSAEELTGRSSRPSTAAARPQLSSASGGKCCIGNRVDTGLSDQGEEEEGQAYDRAFGARKDAVAAATVVDSGVTRQQSGTLPLPTQSPQQNGRDTTTDPCAKKHVKNGHNLTGRFNPEERETNLRDDRMSRLPDEGVDEDEASGSLRLGEAWAIDAKDNPSVWSNCSARLLASVATNDSSAVCNSSVGEGSVELSSGKRSFSTLDTERYRGSLSKDANEILRSHTQSRKEPLSQANSSFSDSHHAATNNTMAMPSPAPPPTRPGQLLDNLFAAREPEHPPPFHLPPMNRSPETCYVRTRGDLILAVVRKRELLKCADDVSFRSLKTAAYPVRIEAGMTLAEGLLAILASGVLRDDATADNIGQLIGRRSRHASGDRSGSGPGGDKHDPSGQAQALEYFNPYAGTWEVVRNESDWRILLAAPAGPQGAGVVFRSASAGANGRSADFLVAVTSPRSQIPSATTQPSENHALSPHPRSNAPRKPNEGRRASMETLWEWRYATPVTLGVLKWLESSNGERIDSQTVTHAQETAKGTEDGGDDDLHQRPAELDGGTTMTGPGPGAALWMAMPTRRNINVPKCVADSPSHSPKKEKVRRLVRYLEAGLMLKGRPGAGGLPARGQKIDMPYTKELAKWSYDEILGIPRTTATVCA
ncbi:unnamed protein product [Hapterophycus canaliculatus]